MRASQKLYMVGCPMCGGMIGFCQGWKMYMKTGMFSKDDGFFKRLAKLTFTLTKLIPCTFGGMLIAPILVPAYILHHSFGCFSIGYYH